MAARGSALLENGFAVRDAFDFPAVHGNATEINPAIVVEEECDRLAVFGEFGRDDSTIEFFGEVFWRAAGRRNDIQRILAVSAVLQLEAREVEERLAVWAPANPLTARRIE